MYLHNAAEVLYFKTVPAVCLAVQNMTMHAVPCKPPACQTAFLCRPLCPPGLGPCPTEPIRSTPVEWIGTVMHPTVPLAGEIAFRALRQPSHVNVSPCRLDLGLFSPFLGFLPSHDGCLTLSQSTVVHGIFRGRCCLIFGNPCLSPRRRFGKLCPLCCSG